MRYWRCLHGHIIGVIDRLGHQDRLYAIYPALPVEPETIKEFTIVGEASDGYVAICTICGSHKRWHSKTKAPVHAGAI